MQSGQSPLQKVVSALEHILLEDALYKRIIICTITILSLQQSEEQLNNNSSEPYCSGFRFGADVPLGNQQNGRSDWVKYKANLCLQ